MPDRPRIAGEWPTGWAAEEPGVDGESWPLSPEQAAVVSPDRPKSSEERRNLRFRFLPTQQAGQRPQSGKEERSVGPGQDFRASPLGANLPPDARRFLNFTPPATPPTASKPPTSLPGPPTEGWGAPTTPARIPSSGLLRTNTAASAGSQGSGSTPRTAGSPPTTAGPKKTFMATSVVDFRRFPLAPNLEASQASPPVAAAACDGPPPPPLPTQDSTPRLRSPCPPTPPSSQPRPGPPTEGWAAPVTPVAHARSTEHMGLSTAMSTASGSSPGTAGSPPATAGPKRPLTAASVVDFRRFPLAPNLDASQAGPPVAVPTDGPQPPPPPAQDGTPRLRTPPVQPTPLSSSQTRLLLTIPPPPQVAGPDLNSPTPSNATSLPGFATLAIAKLPPLPSQALAQRPALARGPSSPPLLGRSGGLPTFPAAALAPPPPHAGLTPPPAAAPPQVPAPLTPPATPPIPASRSPAPKRLPATPPAQATSQVLLHAHTASEALPATPPQELPRTFSAPETLPAAPLTPSTSPLHARTPQQVSAPTDPAAPVDKPVSLELSSDCVHPKESADPVAAPQNGKTAWQVPLAQPLGAASAERPGLAADAATATPEADQEQPQPQPPSAGGEGAVDNSKGKGLPVSPNAKEDLSVSAPWKVLLGGKKHLKTSDVQKVCNRFRELRGGANQPLSNPLLDFEQLGTVVGVDTAGKDRLRSLFELLTVSGGPHCDVRLLLVAAANLTRAKPADRLRFAALLLDERGTGSLSKEQLALILHAHALLGATGPLPRDSFEAKAQQVIEHAAKRSGAAAASATITHEDFLSTVQDHPELLVFSHAKPKKVTALPVLKEDTAGSMGGMPQPPTPSGAASARKAVPLATPLLPAQTQSSGAQVDGVVPRSPPQDEDVPAAESCPPKLPRSPGGLAARRALAWADDAVATNSAGADSNMTEGTPQLLAQRAASPPVSEAPEVEAADEQSQPLREAAAPALLTREPPALDLLSPSAGSRLRAWAADDDEIAVGPQAPDVSLAPATLPLDGAGKEEGEGNVPTSSPLDPSQRQGEGDSRPQSQPHVQAHAQPRPLAAAPLDHGDSGSDSGRGTTEQPNQRPQSSGLLPEGRDTDSGGTRAGQGHEQAPSQALLRAHELLAALRRAGAAEAEEAAGPEGRAGVDVEVDTPAASAARDAAAAAAALPLPPTRTPAGPLGLAPEEDAPKALLLPPGLGVDVDAETAAEAEAEAPETAEAETTEAAEAAEAEATEVAEAEATEAGRMVARVETPETTGADAEAEANAEADPAPGPGPTPSANVPIPAGELLVSALGVQVEEHLPVAGQAVVLRPPSQGGESAPSSSPPLLDLRPGSSSSSSTGAPLKPDTVPSPSLPSTPPKRQRPFVPRLDLSKVAQCPDSGRPMPANRGRPAPPPLSPSTSSCSSSSRNSSPRHRSMSGDFKSQEIPGFKPPPDSVYTQDEKTNWTFSRWWMDRERRTWMSFARCSGVSRDYRQRRLVLVGMMLLQLGVILIVLDTDGSANQPLASTMAAAGLAHEARMILAGFLAMVGVITLCFFLTVRCGYLVDGPRDFEEDEDVDLEDIQSSTDASSVIYAKSLDGSKPRDYRELLRLLKARDKQLEQESHEQPGRRHVQFRHVDVASFEP